jgi:hypothetical protein
MKPHSQDNTCGTASNVDVFDRTIGSLDGLPDVAHSKVTVRRVIPLLGIGGTQLYVVQTYRQKEQGDTIFLEHVSDTGTVRLVIPPQVSSVIARQREQLTTKTRSKAAKAVAQARKERGEVPGFLKSKRKSAGRP